MSPSSQLSASDGQQSFIAKLARRPTLALSPEQRRIALVAAVLLDLMAAALVVPLLPIRLHGLGVSQQVNGMIGSVYSMAQIVGGLIMGRLGDRVLGRRNMLLVSFIGAGTSYSIVGMPQVSLSLLIVSRIVVGLTKQTMTASIALMTELTAAGPERTMWIGRISSASMTAWIIGQSLGGFLNRIGTWLPALVAVTMYAADCMLVIATIPGGGSPCLAKKDDDEGKQRKQPSSFRHFLAPTVLRIVIAKLAFEFVLRAIGAVRLLYELQRWNLTPMDIGYLASYKSVVSILSTWKLVGALSQRYSTLTLLRGATLATAATHCFEAVPGTVLRQLGSDAQWSKLEAVLPSRYIEDPSLLVLILVCIPLHAVGQQMAFISLKSRFTEAVPKDDMASSLASLDVLQSVIGVAAPVFGGFIFSCAPSSIPIRAASLEIVVVVVLLVLYPPRSTVLHGRDAAIAENEMQKPVAVITAVTGTPGV